MTEFKGTVAVVGLGTMGRNLAENLADQGETVVVYNRTTEVSRRLAQKRAGQILVAESLEDLQHLLEPPRRVILLVGGGAQDMLLTRLYKDILGENDILMDFGNSHFRSTEADQVEALKSGIKLLSVGISGGAEGARHGASLMISGDIDAYNSCRALFTSIAANGKGSCEAYLGRYAEGHFVKMVHNGIEYALMQAIGEIVALLLYMHPRVDGDFLAYYFRQVVSESGLTGHLLEIVPQVLEKLIDSDGTGNEDFLINLVNDAASQKGTGSWTSQAALEMGIAAPTSRNASTLREFMRTNSQGYPAGSTAQLLRCPLQRVW